LHQEEPKIGVLALQGGFDAHLKMLDKLGVPSCHVRYPQQLKSCCGLIIPGGESTTIALQAGRMGLIEPVVEFSKTKPIFGTCAGLIWMTYLGLFSITIKRNAYGSQIDSFIEPITFENKPIPAVFIRAPKIEHVYEGVDIKAYHREDPVLISQGLHLGASFHPELTQDSTVHQYFFDRVQKTASIQV
jgi:5'-phosphate synthase pdxT subunit